MTERRDHIVIGANASKAIAMNSRRLCSIVVLEAPSAGANLTIGSDDETTTYITLHANTSRDYGFLGIVFPTEDIRIITPAGLRALITLG